MTSRDFCFWLQGFFELAGPVLNAGALTVGQTELVRRHLQLVFKHEIDPSMGPSQKQTELDKIHTTIFPPGAGGGSSPTGDLVVRC